MDEIKQTLADVVKLTAERQQEKKVKFLGSAKIKKGHTLFEFNFATQEIKPASFEETDIHYSTAKKGGKPHRKVVVNEQCTYVPALNEKNAIRKIYKHYGKRKST